MSITAYNGSGCIAMTGKNCVVLASDRRFGVQQQTISSELDRLHKVNDRTWVAMPGLVTDVQTLISKFNYRTKIYKMREERDIAPRTFAAMVSSMLYEKRFGPFFVEPIVAGLEIVSNKEKEKEKKTEKDSETDEKFVENAEKGDPQYRPFICAMDLIGAPVYNTEFLVGGTANEQLYGICEALYRPNLDPEDLFETVSQCLLAAVDRDCLSGWGAQVVILTKEGATVRQIKSRQD